MESPEQTALEFFEKRDRGAYDRIVDRFTGFVYNIALGVLRDPTLAEDAAQETFVKLLSPSRSYNPTGSFQAWLGRIAYTTALDILRTVETRKKHERRAATERAEKEGEMGEERKWQLARLKALAMELPEEIRTAMQLKYFQKISQVDISEIVGCSPGTISYRIKEGLARLRRSMAGAGLAAMMPDVEAGLLDVPPAQAPPSLVSEVKNLPTTRMFPDLKVRTAMPEKARPGSVLTVVVAVAAFMGLTLLFTGRERFEPLEAFDGNQDVRLQDAGAEAPEDEVEPGPDKDDAPSPGEVPPEKKPEDPAGGKSTTEAPGAAGGEERGEEPERIPVTPTILVRIVDPVGSPIPDAEIRIMNPIPPGYRGPSSGGIVVTPVPKKGGHFTYTEPHVWDGISNADGCFLFGGLSPGRPWKVMARKKGRIFRKKDIPVVPEGEHVEVVLALHETWKIRGTAKDTRGNPICSEFAICLTTTAGGPGLEKCANYFKSGEDGTFSCDEIDPDPDVFSVERSKVTFKTLDYLDETFDSLLVFPRQNGWFHVDLVFHDAASITGTVTDPTGRLLRGVTVWAIPEKTPLSRTFVDKYDFRTDKEGRFTARGLKEGVYTVKAWARGGALVLEMPLEVTLHRAESESVSLVLGKGKRVVGRVNFLGRAKPPRIYLDITFGWSVLCRGFEPGKDGTFELTGFPLDCEGFKIGFMYTSKEAVEIEVIEASPSRLDLLLTIDCDIPRVHILDSHTETLAFPEK